MKSSKFPQTVKVGPCQAKIYATPRKGQQAFTVCYYDADGIRRRSVFSSYETAKEEADALLRRLVQGGSGSAVLRDVDRFAYARALEVLRPTGIPLDLAAHQFVEAVKVLKGTPLLDAARFYARHHCQDRPLKTVREVMDELILNRQKRGVSNLYLRDLRVRLGRFAEAFQCPIASITPSELESFLNALNVKPRTVYNWHTTISTLLRFAQEQGLLCRDHPLLDRSVRSFKCSASIQIFTVTELRALLNAACPNLVAAVAIAAFAGVRAAEIMRLDWADIKLERGFIEIRPEIAKLKTRRRAPIPENLRQWLRPCMQQSGPVTTYKNLGNDYLKLARKAGVKWKRNALRHSFISYRVALMKNVQAVALEAGNSPRMIFTSYLEFVDAQDGEAWFAVTPAANKTVLPAPTAPAKLLPAPDEKRLPVERLGQIRQLEADSSE